VYPLFLLLRPKAPPKEWFIGSLKGFFYPRQLPTAQSSPTRQRSTKSTRTNTTVVNDRTLPSDDSDVEDNPRVFTRCSGPPRSKNRNGKRGRTTIPARSRPRGEGTVLIVFLLALWDCGTGGVLKDAGVVGLRAGDGGGLGATTYRHATASSAPHQWQFLRSWYHGRLLRILGPKLSGF